MPIDYQNAFNVNSANSEGSYDRARGGKIEIKLKIPSKTYTAQGACGGQVTTSEMNVTILIDVEKLPLVNVAGYSIEEEQYAPPTLEYPDDAIVIKEDKTFG
jgi:hypothetical protein